MEYLNRNKNLSMQVRSFTNKESFEKYVKEGIIDILLISEKIEYSSVASDNIKNIFVLSEGRMVNEEQGLIYIYKFQSVDKIIKEVMELYLVKGKKIEWNSEIVKGKETKIIGICSGGDDYRRTLFSLEFGKECSKRMKTLYLNFDLFSPLSEVMKSQVKEGLSELIYYVKEERLDISKKIESVVRKYEDLEYISAVEYPMDLYEITLEDLYKLFEGISSMQVYDLIIVEIGFINEIMIELMESCNMLYDLSCENFITLAKENAFKRMLEMDGRENIIKKMKRIALPEFTNCVQPNEKMYELCKEEVEEYVEECI